MQVTETVFVAVWITDHSSRFLGRTSEKSKRVGNGYDYSNHPWIKPDYDMHNYMQNVSA